MAVRFMVQAPAIKPLDVGQPFRPEGAAAVTRVESTLPGSDLAVVELSMTEDEAENYLREMKSRGQIVAYQKEVPGQYQPAGIVFPYRAMESAEQVMAAHFPLSGLTPEWMAAIHEGVEITIGIADTGTPPERAREFCHWAQIAEVTSHPDRVGHATAVASLVGGKWGVLKYVKLVFAGALSQDGGTISSVTNAIRELADYGVDIINASLGGPRNTLIDQAVMYAQGKGVPLSVAAGNDGPQQPIGSPAARAAFVWGATTRDGSTSASFTGGGNNWDIETGAFPADGIYVAHLDGGYGPSMGTSFAAPVGSGVVAALRKYGRRV